MVVVGSDKPSPIEKGKPLFYLWIKIFFISTFGLLADVLSMENITTWSFLLISSLTTFAWTSCLNKSFIFYFQSIFQLKTFRLYSKSKSYIHSLGSIVTGLSLNKCKFISE